VGAVIVNRCTSVVWRPSAWLLRTFRTPKLTLVVPPSVLALESTNRPWPALVSVLNWPPVIPPAMAESEPAPVFMMLLIVRLFGPISIAVGLLKFAPAGVLIWIEVDAALPVVSVMAAVPAGSTEATVAS